MDDIIGDKGDGHRTSGIIEGECRVECKDSGQRHNGSRGTETDSCGAR